MTALYKYCYRKLEAHDYATLLPIKRALVLESFHNHSSSVQNDWMVKYYKEENQADGLNDDYKKEKD